MGKFIEESLTNGSLIQTGGLAGSAKGGYAILEAESREEAIEATRKFMELHRRHWPEWDGECELRPIDFLAP